jgi:hypothetical protein
VLERGIYLPFMVLEKIPTIAEPMTTKTKRPSTHGLREVSSSSVAFLDAFLPLPMGFARAERALMALDTPTLPFRNEEPFWVALRLRDELDAEVGAESLGIEALRDDESACKRQQSSGFRGHER